MKSLDNGHPGVDEKRLAHIRERFEHYRLGIQELDVGHCWFFEFIEYTCVTDVSMHVVDALDMLELMWIGHLKIEESMMVESSYPYKDSHIDTHEALSADLVTLRARFVGDLAGTCNTVSTRLLKSYVLQGFHDRVVRHIDYEDRQLADYYKMFKSLKSKG